MTDQAQRELGKTLWNIADQLRGAMNADDFRCDILSFLFLRSLDARIAAEAEKLDALKTYKKGLMPYVPHPKNPGFYAVFAASFHNRQIYC